MPSPDFEEQRRKPLPPTPGPKPLPATPVGRPGLDEQRRKPLPPIPGSTPDGVPATAGNAALTDLVESGASRRRGDGTPPVPDPSTKPAELVAEVERLRRQKVAVTPPSDPAATTETTPPEGQVPVDVVQALVTLSKSSPEQINRLFGDWVEAKAGDDKEHKHTLGKVGEVTTTGSAAVGMGMGGYAGAEKVTEQLGELGWAVQVLAEAGFVSGATLELKGSIAKQFGPLAAKAAASLDAFAGVATKAQGKAYVAKGDHWWELGAGAAGKAEFFAGAKGKADAKVTFDAKGLGLELAGEVVGVAGVEGKAEGEVAIDLAKRRLALAGEASFFAGAKIEGSGGGTFRLYGRDAAKVRGTVGATAGIGEKAKIGFKLARGVLAFDLGLGLTVGVGAEGDVATAIDFKPIGVLIMRKYARHLKSHREVEAAGLLATDSDLRHKLRNYAAFKASELRGGAQNFVKIEKVQAYVDLAVDRKKLKANGDRSLDAAITQLITEECRVADKGVAPTSVKVEFGKITELSFPDDANDRIRAGGTPTSPDTYTDAPKVGTSGKDLRKVGA